MCSYIREIVSIQIGHYSNFIGAHWLNLQELSFVYDKSLSTDINHDYLFREALVKNQECYIPRMLIIDAKGSLGSLPVYGNLYEEPFTGISASQALWPGKVEIINQIPEEKNEFLKDLELEDAKYREHMDEDKDVCSEDLNSADTSGTELKIYDLSNKVKVWSDFLRPHLHPKTTFILQDVMHQELNQGLGQNELWDEGFFAWGFQEGVQVMTKERTEEEVVDRIRILAETCGSLQGFHLVCDGHSGMGGVGAKVSEQISDDYGSKDVFSFLATPPCYRPKCSEEVAVFLTNLIQSYTELSKYSSVLVPLYLSEVDHPSSSVVRWPHVSYQEACPYESSSIFAAFLDTVSVPWRVKTDPLPMSHLAHVLTPLKRKVVGSCFSFPIGLEEDVFLRDWLSEEETVETNNRMRSRPIGGSHDLSLPKVAEMSAVRGISQSKLESGSKRMKFENAWQMYEFFLRKMDEETGGVIPRIVSGAMDPLAMASPFPQIFSKDVSWNGYIKRQHQNSTSAVTSAPAMGSFYQGKGIENDLHKLGEAGKKINITKLSRLMSGELEAEVWKNGLEEFFSLVGCYDLPRTIEIDSD